MPTEQAPKVLAIAAEHEGKVQPRHRSDGLIGYTSMRCQVNLDGCDDLACVCVCHATPAPSFAGMDGGGTDGH